jgi:hypothetical protein
MLEHCLGLGFGATEVGQNYKTNIGKVDIILWLHPVIACIRNNI